MNKETLSENYFQRATARAALGKYKAALADFDKAIELAPDIPAVYTNRGVTKNILGRLNEAREDYQKALALAQESSNEDLIATVQRNLRRLDNDKAP